MADEPSVRECISANETAQDLRQAGRLRAAREKLALCVAISCPGPVRKDCATRLAEVDAAMPTIVLQVRDAAGNDLGAVRVTTDGRPFAERLDGPPIAIDPGEHRLTFEAPGMATAEKTIIVREGDKGRHERVVLSSLNPAPIALVVPDAGNMPIGRPGAAVEGHANESEQRPIAPRPGLARGRIPALAFVAFGVGATGLAIGIATGIAAESKHAALEGECQANGDCPLSAQSELDGFHALRTASTIGYILGFAGIAGGAVLWLTAPKGRPEGSSVRVWIGPQSAGLAGTF